MGNPVEELEEVLGEPPQPSLAGPGQLQGPALTPGPWDIVHTFNGTTEVILYLNISAAMAAEMFR